MADTFNLLPVNLEQKEVNGTKVSALSSGDPSLAALMHQINSLTNGFKQSGFVLEVPPPPPQAVNPHRSAQIDKQKLAGNEAFKNGKWGEALKLYSVALDLAASRPPWEPAAMANDEMSILLCNRSAAFLGAELYAEAYADAHACIELKKPWSKGYFRKAKACLKLGRLFEAKEVLEAGLAYEPHNEELKSVMKEAQNMIQDSK